MIEVNVENVNRELSGIPDKIPVGAMLSFKVEGLQGEFKLALVRRNSYFREYELVFVNKEAGKLATGVYSGGATGGGVEEYSLKDLSDYELITTDLEEIKKIVERVAKVRQALREARERIEKRYEEEIKKRFPNPIEAEIQNAKVKVEVKPDQKGRVYLYYFVNRKQVWLSYFITEDNRLLRKKFERVGPAEILEYFVETKKIVEKEAWEIYKQIEKEELEKIEV